MNKYMRAKRFNKYCRYESRVAERKSKKEFRQYCTIILILLLCVVFYAIYIHFWQGEATTIEDQTYTETYTDQAYTEHLVKSNETLWGIAEQYRPNEDTRMVVYEIRKANASRSGERLDPKILPGQVIKVPE